MQGDEAWRRRDNGRFGDIRTAAAAATVDRAAVRAARERREGGDGAGGVGWVVMRAGVRSGRGHDVAR